MISENLGYFIFLKILCSRKLYWYKYTGILVASTQMQSYTFRKLGKFMWYISSTPAKPQAALGISADSVKNQV